MHRDEPGPYHHLIDAERAAAESEGQPADKAQLIRRLREATGIGLRPAKDAVEAYLDRQTIIEGGRGNWVDDFLDAERAAAAREDRPVTRRLLVRALQTAPTAPDPRTARRAVADYLRRRGANLPSGNGPRIALGVMVGMAGLVGLLWLVLVSTSR